MCLASLTINNRGASSSRVKNVEKENLNFTDTILMGLDSMDDAVLKGPDDVTNPFNFKLWWSAPVETLGIKKLETILYKTSTNVELQISNELSSLKAIDYYSTISTEKSTGNAQKNISKQSACHIVTDEVYTNLEQSNAKEAMDIKSNKNSLK